MRDRTRRVAEVLPLRWCAFAALVFFHAFCWAMFVAWTPIAYGMDPHSREAAFWIWVGLALGVIVGASACAIAWAVALMDEGWGYLPNSRRGHRGRRRSTRPLG